MATEDTAEAAKEHRMTPDTLEKFGEDYAKATKERYAIQTGAAGTWTVIRRVDKACPDYEDGPVEEFYSSVCICAGPSTAVKIAEALEQLHPSGDII